MLLKFFDVYVGMGWQPIPVHPMSKIPVGKNWNKDWDYDRCRDAFARNPNYNMGVLLGNIVDVEGDTPEANDLLLRMIDGVPHPYFRSSRSIHHLFQNPDPNLTATRFGGIEFRGYRHQSLLPPSVHENGTSYVWQSGRDEFPPPPMPEELLDFYLKNRREQRPQKQVSRYRAPKLKPGHTRTRCKICDQLIFIHKKRLMLEVRAFAERGYSWMCHTCRPFDVRNACRQIRVVNRSVQT